MGEHFGQRRFLPSKSWAHCPEEQVDFNLPVKPTRAHSGAPALQPLAAAPVATTLQGAGMKPHKNLSGIEIEGKWTKPRIAMPGHSGQ